MTSLSLTLERRVKLFVDQVDAAPDYDDYEELLGVFEWREGLADTVPFDGTLSDEFRAEYLSAEQRFQTMLPSLRERFPEAFAHERERIARRSA